MQIDFHLGVTYVLARMSGFSPFEANTIASSSQYVDDAVESGKILFSNRSAYQFEASAHKMLDYRNFEELANHHVWIPFHFIPGNDVRSSQVDSLVQKLICRPNSAIAQDILKSCIANFDRNFGYHLLGVTTHAYVDTWAHQGFAGLTSEVNKVDEIYDDEGELDEEMMSYRKKYFRRRPWRRLIDWVKSFFVNTYNPVGHGTVLSYPDLPYLRWRYKDWEGRIIRRDNPADYMQAAQHVLEFFKEIRQKHNLPIVKIFDEDIAKLKMLIENITDEDGPTRLETWKSEIRCGAFKFGTDVWKYQAEGPESWLKEAFDIEFNNQFELENVTYRDSFLKSNWKMMHDALIYYRFCVLHEVLPKHEICVA